MPLNAICECKFILHKRDILTKRSIDLNEIIGRTHESGSGSHTRMGEDPARWHILEVPGIQHDTGSDCGRKLRIRDSRLRDDSPCFIELEKRRSGRLLCVSIIADFQCIEMITGFPTQFIGYLYSQICPHIQTVASIAIETFI